MPPELARIAVEEHLADVASVTHAHEEAQRQAEAFVVALVRTAHVSDAALARALARRLDLPLHASLDPDPDALREIAHDLAERHRLVPVALELPVEGPRLLRVAMADPTDHEALALVEASTGCRVEVVLASLGVVEDAIARAYRGLVTEVIPRAETEPAPGPEPSPAREPRATQPPRLPFGAEIPEVSTQPFHRLDDEAPVELRLRALVQLLAEKGLLGEDEWLERIRLLLRERE